MAIQRNVPEKKFSVPASCEETEAAELERLDLIDHCRTLHEKDPQRRYYHGETEVTALQLLTSLEANNDWGRTMIRNGILQ